MERDEHGNIKCKKCGKFSSENFKKCVHCCPHNNLKLVERWHGPDDAVYAWELEAECSDCGKNYGFDNKYLINHFKLVRVNWWD